MRITILTGYYKEDIDNMITCFDYDTVGVEVIEYPEVYVHQQELVNKLKSCIENKEMRYIIKTFSDVVVNVMGVWIDTKLISNKDVALYLKDKYHEIYKVEYNEKGFLEESPFGFFGYDI